MKRWIVPAFALLCLSRSASALDPPPTYPVGSHPWDMVVGDFNNDGRPDLAVANVFGRTVSVLLGNGDGTFQAARNSVVDYYPHSLLAGDLNGDAKSDLVTFSEYYGSYVLLGNGDGTFRPPQQGGIALPGVAAGTERAALGDLNGDGRLDLVAASFTSTLVGDYDPDGPYGDTRTSRADGYLSVLLGNGDGTFGAVVVEPLGEGVFIERLALGDFNGDGRADVVSDELGGLGVRLGNGDGTLQAPRQSPVGAGLMNTSTPVGDFDRDGKLDVLIQSSDSFAVSLGNGHGTFLRTDFAPLGDAVQNPFGSAVPSAAVGDVNTDGKLDIVVVRSSAEDATRSAVVLLGNGDGTFHVAPIWDLGKFVGNSYLSAAVLADLDGDGLPELAAADAYQDAVVLAHNPGGRPLPSPPIRIDVRISDVARPEGQSSTTPFVFTVTLSSALVEPVTVQFATANGTAKVAVKKGSTSDYVATSGSLTFAPGKTTKSITVQVTGDRKAEADETFFVKLSGAVNAFLVDDSGLATIVNDD